MQLQIQGRKCHKYIAPSSYRKRSVYISLFIGKRPASNHERMRPKSSVISYVQRKVLTPTVKDGSLDKLSSPIYMPVMLSKTPPPNKLRYYSSKSRTQDSPDVTVPSEIALKNLNIANLNKTRVLNLSLNVGRVSSSPVQKLAKPGLRGKSVKFD